MSSPVCPCNKIFSSKGIVGTIDQDKLHWSTNQFIDSTGVKDRSSDGWSYNSLIWAYANLFIYLLNLYSSLPHQNQFWVVPSNKI